jgi:hypothetical protein
MVTNKMLTMLVGSTIGEQESLNKSKGALIKENGKKLRQRLRRSWDERS